MNQQSVLKIGIPNNIWLSFFDFQVAKSGLIMAIFWKQKMTVIGPDFVVIKKGINAKIDHQNLQAQLRKSV